MGFHQQPDGSLHAKLQLPGHVREWRAAPPIPGLPPERHHQSTVVGTSAPASARLQLVAGPNPVSVSTVWSTLPGKSSPSSLPLLLLHLTSNMITLPRC